ncbi:MAG: nicotinate phosphoribosyltransferase, partial [Elusimicrobiota bacterium]
MSLLTDLYELTMMQGYFFERKNFEVVFDMYYRYQPFKGGYSTFAGLKPLAEAILNFGFNEDDIMY